MSTQDTPSWSHSNLYSADAACAHCEGILHHEPWCESQNETVHYANQAVKQAARLSLADRLHLHSLGVSWLGDSSQAELWGTN